ncbi:type II secretion system F family protein [Fervidibacter sacchari]
MRRRNLIWLLTAATAGFFVGFLVFRRQGPLPSKDEINRTLNELAIALHQGRPLLHAIERAANKTTHPRLKKAWSDVLNLVSQGRSLSKAMSVHRDIFPNELILAIQKGEIEGNVDIVLLNYTARH